MLKSPKNYNEMLSSLNLYTALSTFIFIVILVGAGVVPKISVPPYLIPPGGDNQEFYDWIASFGLVPIAAATVAFALSRVFEMHNVLSKTLQIRYVWEKKFIVQTLASRASASVQIDRPLVRSVMNELFYPEVKKIDEHYVHLFWRYALTFWILFEHVVIVLVTCVVLVVLTHEDLVGLWIYLIAVVIVAALQFLFVTARKSRDQARQIPIDRVQSYFAGSSPIVRL